MGAELWCGNCGAELESTGQSCGGSTIFRCPTSRCAGGLLPECENPSGKWAREALALLERIPAPWCCPDEESPHPPGCLLAAARVALREAISR